MHSSQNVISLTGRIRITYFTKVRNVGMIKIFCSEKYYTEIRGGQKNGKFKEMTANF